MSTKTATKSRTRRPSTVSLPTVDGIPVTAAPTPEPTLVPVAPKTDPADAWQAFADPSAAASALKVTQHAGAYTQRAAEAAIRTALAAYADIRSGSSWSEVQKTTGTTRATLSNLLILGAMLAQVGEDLTMRDALALKPSARKVAGSHTDLVTLLDGAPTGAAFLTYVAEKVTAIPPKTRAPRVGGSEAEGDNPRTGEAGATPEPTLVPASPDEVIRAATKILTLAAHDGSALDESTVRALDAALTAYCDRFPKGRALSVKVSKPRAPRVTRPVVVAESA